MSCDMSCDLSCAVLTQCDVFSWSKTVGVFWHNAAETWIDITNAAANKVGIGYLTVRLL